MVKANIFTAKRDNLVDLFACVVLDGYTRYVSSNDEMQQTSFAVDGKIMCVIGRVQMDMLLTEITNIPNVNIDSNVEFGSDQVSANLLLHADRSIAYKLFCNLKRVKYKCKVHEIS